MIYIIISYNIYIYYYEYNNLNNIYIYNKLCGGGQTRTGRPTR